MLDPSVSRITRYYLDLKPNPVLSVIITVLNQTRSHPECNASFQLLQAARFSLTILICIMLRLLISASTLFNATITSYESIIPFSYNSAAKNLCQHHNR